MKLPKGWIYIAKPIRKGTAVEIEQRDLIFCEECMHWDKTVDGHINVGDHLCRRTMRWTLETDYCSDGKRRTETLDERIKRGLKEWKEK